MLLWHLFCDCIHFYFCFCGCSSVAVATQCLSLLAECTRWRGEVSGKEGQEVEWCSVAEIRRRDLPPADLPLVDAVERAAHLHAQTALSIAT